MKKFLTIGAVVVIIAVAFGIYRYLVSTKAVPQKKAKAERPIGVKTMKVSYEEGSETISYTGRVASQGTVQLGTEVSGRIIKGDMPLKEGQTFRKGQTIVRVFSEDAKQNLIAAKASYLNRLSSALPDIKVDYPNQYNKWYTFFESIDLNKSLPKLPSIASSQEKVYLASTNLLSDYYSIRQQEITYQKYRIAAPFNGVFMSVQKEVGSIATMGGTVATIIQTDRQEIIVPFLPQDVMQVKKGDRATILLRDGTSISGKVVRIGEFVDSATQMVNVYVAPEKNNAILSGQYLTVQFAGLNMDSVVKVPREAVFNGNKMFKVANSKLEEIEVNVIRTSDDNNYVNGIPEGVTVVTESIVKASEGDVVRSL